MASRPSGRERHRGTPAVGSQHRLLAARSRAERFRFL